MFCNDGGQLKSTWLGKAPEKMQLHHLGFSFVKLLLEDLKKYPIRMRIWRGKLIKNDWQAVVMWYSPCGNQSSDTKHYRSYYYFKHTSVPFELNINIIMPLVSHSVLRHLLFYSGLLVLLLYSYHYICVLFSIFHYFILDFQIVKELLMQSC